MNFLDKTDWTQLDIEEIVESKFEESVSVEFKSSRSLANTDNAKKELSKDISAFANSDGGVIFYGIEENNHTAASISFTDGTTITKEWVENVISTNIHRKIDDLLIYPIRFDGDITKTVYVLNIPASPSAPHMAKDKRFYRRSNFQSVQMEEYEVRNTYLRRQNSKLMIVETQITTESFENLIDAGIYKLCFTLNLLIKNVGNFPADYYKALIILNKIDAVTIRKNLWSSSDITLFENKWHLSSTKTPVLFPDEVYSAITVDLEIVGKGFPLVDESFDIQTKLFFPGGEDSEVFPHTKSLNELYEKLRAGSR
jgi:predicted HTH transcriptional regulator